MTRQNFKNIAKKSLMENFNICEAYFGFELRVGPLNYMNAVTQATRRMAQFFQK